MNWSLGSAVLVASFLVGSATLGYLTGGDVEILPESSLGAIVGSTLQDFECLDNIATCDQINFGTPCGATIPEGGFCLNCTNEEDMHDNCVQKAGASCVQNTGAKDCGFKWLGKCTGNTCTGLIQNLSDTCAIDANDCS